MSERTPQDVLREAARNLVDRGDRFYRDRGPSHRAFWDNEIRDLREALDEAIAEAPDSPPFAGHIGPEPWPETARAGR